MKRTRASTLVVRPAPFLEAGANVRGIMGDVLLATVPLIIAAIVFFGPAAILVIGASTLGAVGTEYLLTGRKIEVLRDLSGVLTGVLLGLTLPPGTPIWMALLGGVAGMGLGKLVWGGLGQNPFNPALVGRAFLQAAFPVAMTTWPGTREAWWHMPSTVLGIPLMHPIVVDGSTGATPLGLHKFEGQGTELVDLLLGTIHGSLGETSALLILLCAAYLIYKRAFDWRIPVAIVATVLAVSTALYLWDPVAHATPWFMLGSGGLLFGSVFMATDPVTSPTTPLGSLFFGIGIGVIVVLIRAFGGLPEGVMYAILLMNAAAPLLERWTQPRPFGQRRTG